MPVVRYTADGGHYRVGGHGFDPGDEHDVSAELAAYLADLDEFEVAEDAGDAEGDEEPVREGDICGYETDNGVCQRDAGWGRDADSGRCKDHVDDAGD